MARSRKEHQEISRLLLGYSDPRVHSLMDWHVRFLGPGHRIAGHSLQMLDAIELLLGSNARREALLHLLVDAHIVRVGGNHEKTSKKEPARRSPGPQGGISLLAGEDESRTGERQERRPAQEEFQWTK
jgi:hypothetical protein